MSTSTDILVFPDTISIFVCWIGLFLVLLTTSYKPHSSRAVICSNLCVIQFSSVKWLTAQNLCISCFGWDGTYTAVIVAVAGVDIIAEINWSINNYWIQREKGRYQNYGDEASSRMIKCSCYNCMQERNNIGLLVGAND